MIDCLFVGHNEMQFDEYEKMVRSMGTRSEAYRDLLLNFIWLDGKPLSVPEAFNHFYGGPHGPFSLGETFSAAIAYLGTYLDRRGHSFDYVNSFQDQKDELAEKLRKGNIRCVAIITTLYVTSFPILEIMAFVKKHNKDAKVILGGPFVSTNCRIQPVPALQYLFESIGADFYVNSSQGEATLSELLRRLKSGEDCGTLPNTYLRKDGKFQCSGVHKEENPLEQNMVEWPLFSRNLGRYVALRTAISCPFSCAFCGFPEHAGEYQTSNVSHVERELDGLVAAGNVASVHFIDDTFNVPPKRFKEILRLLIRKRYGFRWHSFFRCQFADEETVDLMRESGCEGVFLGIESGSQRILENMNKAAAIDKYAKGISLLKKHGIITFASLVMGFPGETAETVQETVDFIEQNGPDFYRGQVWYCEQVTPIWRKREEYGIEGSQFKWKHKTMESQTACDLTDDMFNSIRNSIWLPQYNMDFPGLFHFMHRGLDLAHVKAFLAAFQDGIGEYLRDPSLRNVSSGVRERMRKAATPPGHRELAPVLENVEFDFEGL